MRRGNVRHQNLVLLNAILYVAEHGYKWRGLPKRSGNGHSVFSRFEKLDIVFLAFIYFAFIIEALQ